MITARADARLSATVEIVRALRYDDGADAAQDRPALVRAGSALRWFGDWLAVVQDDVCFLALVDLRGPVGALALPPGPGGRRRFEDALGNRSEKLDMEAAVTLEGPRGPRQILFGSGSKPTREQLVVVELDGAVHAVDGAELYAMLRRERRFSGAELNVEGVIAAGDRLRLLQRGNGAPRADLDAVNAVLDLDLASFQRWLDDGGALPDPLAIEQYDLGQVDDVRFGFTDATVLPDGRALFVAVAEDSPNAVDDGPVLGCRLGVLDDGGARYATLMDEAGASCALKIEGIEPDRHQPRTYWAVTDADDPDAPSLLCRIRLAGPF